MDEEESEFLDLVSQMLENKGVLSKIRAQLRASVFLALEDDEKLDNLACSKNKELKAFLSSPSGCQAFGLVKDLLEYFGLEHSLSVLTQEAGLDTSQLHVTGIVRPFLLQYLIEHSTKQEGATVAAVMGHKK